MSYDPDRTTVLPSTPSEYPITDELPAVQVRSGESWLVRLSLLAVVIAIGVGGFFAANYVRNRPTGTVTQSGGDAPTAVPLTENEIPTAVPAVAEPGWWQVVGVDEGLNVRSGPGTSSDVVGALLAGQRHVLATGNREAVAGGEWMEIEIADGRTGWVSARFLAGDSAPPEGSAQATAAPVSGQEIVTVCFAAGETVARIDIANRVDISGRVQIGSGQAEVLQIVTGTFGDQPGQADMVISDADTGERERRTWTFNPTSVDLGNGVTVSVIGCAAIDL